MRYNGSPCKGCEKQGCGAYHDKCEKYQEFLQEMAKEREARAEYMRKHPTIKINRKNNFRTPENSPIKSHKRR